MHFAVGVHYFIFISPMARFQVQIPTKWNSFSSSSSGKAVGHIAARNCSILSLLQGRDLGSYFNLDFQFQGLETTWKDFEYIFDGFRLFDPARC
jgi:hypothetical protein